MTDLATQKDRLFPLRLACVNVEIVVFAAQDEKHEKEETEHR